MNYKPRIVRTWVTCRGIFVWTVHNQPSRKAWTGYVDREEMRRWQDAWRYVSMLNAKEEA